MRRRSNPPDPYAPPAPRERNPPDRFVYSGIRVRSLARSLRFYRAIGFRVVKEGRFSHGGRWVHLEYPGSAHRLELNYYPKGSPFYEPIRGDAAFDHFGFYSPDPLRWLRRMVRAGATPVVGFVDGPVELLFVRDPDGVWLGTCGPAEPVVRRRPARRSRPARARRAPGSSRSSR